MDKGCQHLLKMLQCRLPELEAAGLQTAYSDWWRVQSETPFGKGLKSRAARSEIALRQDSQTALIARIDAVRRGVLGGRIKLISL